MGGGRSPTPPIEENKAFVRGLTDDVNEEMITQVFSKYGRVTEVYLARDYETKVPRGFAFVTFESSKDCEDACKGLNGKEFRGKPLHVERSAKPRGSGSSRGFRGSGRGRSGYVSRAGRSPPHSSRDYEYRSRPSGNRDDRNAQRGSRRPYTPRGGRGRAPSPPPREYDYHSRSPPMPPSSRSRYDVEYRSTRPRHDYTPPPRREYEPVGRGYPTLAPREYYDYPAANGRYSPGPAPRREYETSARAYEMSRHDGYGYRTNESSRGYGGSYSTRVGSGYGRASPPARPTPRDYPHATSREGNAVRRPAMRSVSPPPKRMKTAGDSYERRGSPPPRAPTSSRRF